MKANYTAEHTRILEKNRSYYDALKSNGTLNKISSVTVGEFQRIYNEAIGEKVFAVWCSACVVELIEDIYRLYEKNKANDQGKESEAITSTGTIAAAAGSATGAAKRVRQTRKQP